MRNSNTFSKGTFISNYSLPQESSIPINIETDRNPDNSQSKKKQIYLNFRKKNLSIDSKEILDIPNHSELCQLVLCYNNLTEYPNDLLTLNKIISLDIRKNPFENFDELISRLSTYKNLTDLKIDLKNSEQVQKIITKMPNLIMINGKSTKDFNIPEINEELFNKISIKNALEIYKNLFNNLYEKSNEKSIEDGNKIKNEFQELIDNEANKYNNSDEENNNFINCFSFLKSKNKILNFFIDKLCEIYNFSENEKQIFDLYKGEFNNYNELFDTFIEKVYNIYTNLQKQNENSIKYINDLSYEYYHNIYKYSNSIGFNEDEKKFYLTKIERLEKENKYMTDKLIETGKNIIKNNHNFDITTNLISSNNTNNNTNHLDNAKYLTEKTNSTNKNPLQNSIENQRYYTTVNNININNQIPPVPNNTSSNFNNTNSISIANNKVGITGAKEMPIKIIKELIKEIYSSKIIYDLKCKESNQPRITMEQHMYNYLNKKYGLKNLVIETASSLILCIKNNSNSDSDINLFGKILRNEQEEESQIVMNKLITTINDIILNVINNKNKLKSTEENKKHYENIVKNKTFINEDYWKTIIYIIHQKDEADIIYKKIIKFIQKNKNGACNNVNNYNNNNYGTNKEPKNLTREEIKNMEKNELLSNIYYKDFCYILTDYQINYRDQYLCNFLNLFKKFDTDYNGVLNEEEFINMCKEIKVVNNNGEQYINYLLSCIDPNNYKRVTFSQCVGLFSTQKTKDSISILDQMCIEQ